MIVKQNIQIIFRTPGAAAGTYTTIESVSFTAGSTIDFTSVWANNNAGVINNNWEVVVYADGDDVEVEDPFARIQFKFASDNSVLEVLWEGQGHNTILANGVFNLGGEVHSKFYSGRKYYYVSIAGDLQNVVQWDISGKTEDLRFPENTLIFFNAKAKTYRVFRSIVVDGTERLTNSQPDVNIYLGKINANMAINVVAGYDLDTVIRVKTLGSPVLNKGFPIEIWNYSGKNLWVSLIPGPTVTVGRPLIALDKNSVATVYVTVNSLYDTLTLDYAGGPTVLGLNPSPDVEFDFGGETESAISILQFPALVPPNFKDIVIDDPMRYGKTFIAPGVRLIFRKDIPFRRTT